MFVVSSAVRFVGFGTAGEQTVVVRSPRYRFRHVHVGGHLRHSWLGRLLGTP